MSNLAKNIRTIREMKGIKQAEIARLLNKTQLFISKMENGKVDITPKNIETIAKYFGLEKESLENFDDSIFFNVSQNPNSNDKHISNQTLTENERKLYQEYIDLLRKQNSSLQTENQKLKDLVS
ncbi:helix-turn-helix domain-containing protein [Emticicia sp. SJ17W-69]|uniref:helix-turn-helix domain-containing protein n=1 Tax=Emticicia sp. SJ17W-69 TaxID=3421657 RepID=UPI003EBA10B8